MLPFAYRVNVSASFPTQVVGKEGVEVSKASGVYSIGSAYETLAPLGSVPAPAQKMVKVFDSVTGVYNTAPLTVLASGGAILLPLNNTWTGTNTFTAATGFTAPFGYTTGGGGTVTQTTNQTTTVTINKPSGAITLASGAGAPALQAFVVNNSTVKANDTIIFSQLGGTNRYNIFASNVATGSFVLNFYSMFGTSTETPIFQFNVIHGSNS
jgi:hypothetical protein